MTDVLIRGVEDTHRRPCENRCKDWNAAATSQGMPKIAGSHQKLGRRKGELFLSDFRGGMVPSTIWHETFSHQNCEIITLVLF